VVSPRKIGRKKPKENYLKKKKSETKGGGERVKERFLKNLTGSHKGSYREKSQGKKIPYRDKREEEDT